MALLAYVVGDKANSLGELAGQATNERYRLGGERMVIIYKILTKPGRLRPAALALCRARKDGGPFVLVACPAEYRNSSVMTLPVNHRGEVFRKGLGTRTAQLNAPSL